MNLPLYSSVPAGSPAPIDDAQNFDLAGYLIHHPNDTFYVRVIGDSMIDGGIFDGDLLIVDRAREAKSNDIVVAQTEDGLTVKRFNRDRANLRLVPANKDYAPVQIDENSRVCGVAVFAIHKL